MERIYEAYEENKQTGIDAFEDSWKEISSGLENFDETTEELFTYYVYMKLKENPKNSLFEEFKKIIKNEFNTENKIDKFITEFNSFYKIYLSLFDERADVSTYRKIHSMMYLREGRFWKTILITYALKNPSKDIKELVDILFEFYYLNFIAGESVNPYKQFSFKLIKDIAEGNFDIVKLRENINDYYKRQNTIYRFRSKIKGEIYNERWAKVLFYLIEYFCYKDKEDTEIFEQNNSKIQLEHIFPKSEKNWKEITQKEPEIKKLKNTLGNLTLLYQSNNVKCSNLDFKLKLETYKKSQKFNHTKEILKFDDWNTETIKQREANLLKQIALIFNLPENNLLNETEDLTEEIEEVDNVNNEKKMKKDKPERKEVYTEDAKEKLRLDFWKEFLAKSKLKTNLHSDVSPSKYHWIGTGSGKSGITYNYVILNSYVGCEIYIDRGSKFVEPNINKVRFDELFKHKKEIEEVFGEELSWQRLDEKRACRIAFVLDYGINDKAKWPEMQDKMIDVMIRLEKASKPFIMELSQ